MKRLTTKDIIIKSKETHGDKFIYTDLKYENANKKVDIICRKHGVFSMRANLHIDGRGCPKCSGYGLNEDDVKDITDTVYKGKYSFISCEKGKFHYEVKLNCHKHGKFVKRFDHIKEGSICPVCVKDLNLIEKTKEFLTECKEIHGDKYDYSLVEYESSHKKVTIICYEHGEFYQTPSSHKNSKSGCPSCAGNANITLEDFINRSKSKHNNFYTYENSIINSTKKVIITCPIHGDFEQNIHNHINGQGCYNCGRNSINEYRKNNPTTWTSTNWQKLSEKSKKFDSFKVYIIRCWDENEEFYKIGKTFQPIKYRFSSFHYSYEIINEFIFDNAKDCTSNEAFLKRIHKQFKCIPQTDFGGMYECFSYILDEYKK